MFKVSFVLFDVSKVGGITFKACPKSWINMAIGQAVTYRLRDVKLLSRATLTTFLGKVFAIPLRDEAIACSNHPPL